MRLVYVFLVDDPNERRYLIRLPRVLARLLIRRRPEYDYALFWFHDEGA